MTRAPGPKGPRKAVKAHEKGKRAEVRPKATILLREPRRLTEDERSLLASKPSELLTWQEAASILMTIDPEHWDPDYRRKRGEDP